MLQQHRSFFRYLPVSPSVRAWGIYVVNAGHAVVPPGSPFPPCQHPPDHHMVWDRGRILPTYHFLYIAEGAGEYESQPSGARRLGPGDLVILQPGMWHRYRPVWEVGWHEYWLEFDGDHARRLMNRPEFREAAPIIQLGACQPFLEVIARVIDLLHQERPGTDLILGALAVEAMAELLSAMKRKQQGGRLVTDIIREAKHWLSQGPAQRERMDEFAERLNLSYSAFRRLFKAETGYSPRQFVLEVQMRRAKELLASSEATISQIAQELGFESIYYFSRLFKKRHGSTPSAFRGSARRALQPNVH
jgi:AraC-like DNA-binding protein